MLIKVLEIPTAPRAGRRRRNHLQDCLSFSSSSFQCFIFKGQLPHNYGCTEVFGMLVYFVTDEPTKLPAIRAMLEPQHAVVPWVLGGDGTGLRSHGVLMVDI